MKVVAQGKVKYKGKYYHEKMIFDHEKPEKKRREEVEMIKQKRDRRTLQK